MEKNNEVKHFLGICITRSRLLPSYKEGRWEGIESDSRSVVSDTLWPHELYSTWTSPGQDTGVGCCSLLQGTYPTQGSNPGLPHCRWILCQPSHQGNPRILEWVVYPFSRGSSRPRNQTWVSWIIGEFFTSWATREDFLLQMVTAALKLKDTCSLEENCDQPRQYF